MSPFGPEGMRAVLPALTRHSTREGSQDRRTRPLAEDAADAVWATDARQTGNTQSEANVENSKAHEKTS